MNPDPGDELRRAGENFADAIDASLGPLRRIGNLNAQLATATIPADAACHCLCSIYTAHICEGWSAEGSIREVPAATVWGWTPPPARVPVCHTCRDAPLRTG